MSGPEEPRWYREWQADSERTLRKAFGDQAADIFVDIPDEVPWHLRYELQIAFMRAVLSGITSVANGHAEDATANAIAVYREHCPSVRGVGDER